MEVKLNATVSEKKEGKVKDAFQDFVDEVDKVADGPVSATGLFDGGPLNFYTAQQQKEQKELQDSYKDKE